MRFWNNQNVDFKFTFIRYAQNGQIGKPNKFNILCEQENQSV